MIFPLWLPEVPALRIGKEMMLPTRTMGSGAGPILVEENFRQVYGVGTTHHHEEFEQVLIYRDNPDAEN